MKNKKPEKLPKTAKTAYVVELRKRKGTSITPNNTVTVAGVFSTRKKAIKWIETEGTVGWGKSKRKFWAISESVINIGESFFSDFYGMDGKLINVGDK